MSAHFRTIEDLPVHMRDPARRQLLGQPTPEVERSQHIDEKAEQAAIVKLFRERGCKVYNLSQARASKQTAGLPDLWVFHVASRRGWWWESKKQVGGVMSEVQKEFADLCLLCRVMHGSGDRYDAKRFLEELGL